MQSPARQRDRCPIPPHSSVHALNLKLSTEGSLLTPLFAASPSISRLSPLATAFTHFDRVVWVAFHFPLDSQLSLASRGSLRQFVYFQHLTNRSAAETLSNRVSNPFPLETYKSLFQQLLCFVIYTKHPGVTPPLSFGQSLGSANAPPFPLSLRGPTSRSQSLKTRRIISLRASGANHGSRQEKQIAEIRRESQQSQRQTERQAGRQIQLCSARQQGQGCSHRQRRCCGPTRERGANRSSLERRR